jgi:hypothetical protein
MNEIKIIKFKIEEKNSCMNFKPYFDIRAQIRKRAREKKRKSTVV